MPTRVQSLRLGFGNKQSDISTLSGAFYRFKKLDMGIYTMRFNTENDAAEIGKGNEFISQHGVFPVSWDMEGRIEKYGSAEWVLWAWGMALGGGGGGTYSPLDPNVGLEPPYFSIVQYLLENSIAAINQSYIGCAVEDVETVFNYGPGRQSIRTNVTFVGSGQHAFPGAGGSLPSTPLSEHYMIAQSATISISTGGTSYDYVARKSMLNGTISWRNNLLRNAGYYIGSGVADYAGNIQHGSSITTPSAAVRGRIEVGARVPTFNFTIRSLSLSGDLSSEPEFTDLVNANINDQTGACTITFWYNSGNNVTFSIPYARFQSAEHTEVDGIAALTIGVAPLSSEDTGTQLMTVSGTAAGASPF